VDTPDWADHVSGLEDSKEIIDGFVDGSKLARPNVWVPDSWIQAARKKNIKIEDLSHDSVFDALKTHAPLPRSEVVIGRIRDVGVKVLPLLSEQQALVLSSRLKGDSIYSTMIADKAAVIIRGISPDAQVFDLIRSSAAILDCFIAPVSAAITAYQRHRGPREIVVFLEYLSSERLFPDATILRIREIIADENGIQLNKLDDIENALRSEKMPATITNYIRSLAAEAMGSTVINRLITRLENDQAMKAALK